MEYGKKDFMVGDVLVTKTNQRYVLVVDEKGNWGVISGDGPKQIPGLANYIEFDRDGNFYVTKKKGDNGKVVRVYRFDCEPGVNRLSEALKMLTGRAVLAEKDVIWSADDDKKAEAIKENLEKMYRQGITGAEILEMLKQ